MSPTPTTTTKHYIPLESNPEVFTHLINKLGVHGLEFHDIYSLDDLSLVPRPVLALILVFPTTQAFERELAKEEAVRQEYVGSGDGEDVVWFRQTINNACGLYGILHAVCNGKARSFVGEFVSIPKCHGFLFQMLKKVAACCRPCHANRQNSQQLPTPLWQNS
jgi:ubiquitin carboxyl-terminal hydrolase L3